jgi:hypothetical protein
MDCVDSEEESYILMSKRAPKGRPRTALGNAQGRNGAEALKGEIRSLAQADRRERSVRTSLFIEPFQGWHTVGAARPKRVT